MEVVIAAQQAERSEKSRRHDGIQRDASSAGKATCRGEREPSDMSTPRSVRAETTRPEAHQARIVVLQPPCEAERMDSDRRERAFRWMSWPNGPIIRPNDQELRSRFNTAV